jgi:DtxR family transcriptional regulator, Mn-dependent transcriptional regulator
MHSFTEENYLKLIYALARQQGGEVGTNALAEVTATRAASVTDMLRKLADKSLINYRKYQGVSLTEAGEREALRVIRRHRLWEVFLVEKLGFGWDAVHDIAEELEHIQSDELVARLDQYLDFPQFDPHGDPIPTSAGQVADPGYRPLSEVGVGERVCVMGVQNHSPAFLQHLDKIGLGLGCHLTVTDTNTFDRSLTVTIAEAPALFISHDVARNLLVA